MAHHDSGNIDEYHHIQSRVGECRLQNSQRRKRRLQYVDKVIDRLTCVFYTNDPAKKNYKIKIVTIKNKTINKYNCYVIDKEFYNLFISCFTYVYKTLPKINRCFYTIRPAHFSILGESHYNFQHTFT